MGQGPRWGCVVDNEIKTLNKCIILQEDEDRLYTPLDTEGTESDSEQQSATGDSHHIGSVDESKGTRCSGSYDMFTKANLFLLHFGLHDPTVSQVAIFDKTNSRVLVDISVTKSDCRYCVVNGVMFIEQNPETCSEYAELAKEGNKITYVSVQGHFGRKSSNHGIIQNNRIIKTNFIMQLINGESLEYETPVPIVSRRNRVRTKRRKVGQTPPSKRENNQPETPTKSGKSPHTCNSPLPLAASPASPLEVFTPIRSRKDCRKRRRRGVTGALSPLKLETEQSVQ